MELKQVTEYGCFHTINEDQSVETLTENIT